MLTKLFFLLLLLLQVASVVSDSVRPQRQQTTRLHGPWDSPGKNTGVDCHFLLQCMKVKAESEVSCSVVPNSSQPHGLQPTRLLHPWDFPGKNTGVGCHRQHIKKQRYYFANKGLSSQGYGFPSSHVDVLDVRVGL